MKIILFIVSACVLSNVTIAQPGSLDKEYGNNGKVIDAAFYPFLVSSSAIQKDQKLVVAGTRESQLLVKRYLTDGSIDINFGEKGTVITNFIETNFGESKGAV